MSSPSTRSESPPSAVSRITGVRTPEIRAFLSTDNFLRMLFSYAVVSFFTPNTFLKKKPRKPLSFLTTTTFMSQASCLKLSAYERYGQDDHNDRHDPYHKAVRKQTGTSESQRKIKSAFPLALIIASYHMFFTA